MRCAGPSLLERYAPRTAALRPSALPQHDPAHRAAADALDTGEALKRSGIREPLKRTAIGGVPELWQLPTTRHGLRCRPRVTNSRPDVATWRVARPAALFRLRALGLGVVSAFRAMRFPDESPAPRIATAFRFRGRLGR
jgi:hypothetical protein